MKKLSIILILVMLLSLCSCAKQEVEDLSHLTFEYDNNANYFYPSSMQDYYDMCEYVVVASPIDTFEESEQIWTDSYGQATTDFASAIVHKSCTFRKFKVHKVLKGEDTKLKEITVGENAISDGEKVKIEGGEYISQKGKKYLLLLHKGMGENSTIYWPGLSFGKYEINSKNNESNEQIGKKLYKEAKELFKEEFE